MQSANGRLHIVESWHCKHQPNPISATVGGSHGPQCSPGNISDSVHPCVRKSCPLTDPQSLHLILTSSTACRLRCSGYALTIFIPISLVCIIPLESVRWIFVVLSTLMSGSFLFTNLRRCLLEVPTQQ